MTLLWATHLISLQNGKGKDRGRRVDAIGERLHRWGSCRRGRSQLSEAERLGVGPLDTPIDGTAVLRGSPRQKVFCRRDAIPPIRL
jgi:hypothetical protein